ncbi:uncharacterized protein LOC119673372 [Teleopsis dalmanni]|uniref:uncharacterized protein LOC119673372 n=1 Tax=Teleopsis dalmanni TaxID=139649 RepID=UPI0018CD3FED|nr:uncharacterized protein LOC119673372 [Teleopsis dalmanni]
MTDQQLDQEFHCNLIRFNDIIKLHCNYREKIVVTEWISKLKSCSTNTDERKLRNMFLEHFIQCCNADIFRKPPFNKNISTSANLIDYAHYLPKLAGIKKEAPNTPWKTTMKNVTEMFSISHEFSDFLSQLPVPRDGGIFIMNIKKKEDC